MALAQQMSDFFQQMQSTAPKPILEKVGSVHSQISSTFDSSHVLKPGDMFPAFDLPNAVGESISSVALLRRGPLLVTFYRGEWCPFCNMAIASFQKYIEQIHAKGAEVVAISPELPNTSITMAEKHSLSFPVLSDVNLTYAKRLGIVWQPPKQQREIFEAFGVDLTQRTGNDSLEVPIPATFLVAQDGTIKRVYADPDYTHRIEPKTAVAWLDEL